MKFIIRTNYGLFIRLLLVSFLLAYPFGYVTWSLAPSYGLSSALFPDEVGQSLNGFFWIYLILTPLIFGIWGIGRRWLKILIISLPALALAFIVGQSFLGWSLIFFGSSIALTIVINFLKRK